ncbi:MAG: helix-hairpin-helix domain-containing protein [Candidatus Edwardsbacteria bacterium]
MMKAIFNFTPQEKTVIIFLTVSFFIGGAITLYRRHRPNFSSESKLYSNFSSVERCSTSYFNDSTNNRKILDSLLAENKRQNLLKKEEQFWQKKSFPPDIRRLSDTGKVNINIASQRELEKLPGIGPVMARKIIDYRTRFKEFKTKEQIKEVGGIGEKTFQKLRDHITVE